MSASQFTKLLAKSTAIVRIKLRIDFSFCLLEPLNYRDPSNLNLSYCLKKVKYRSSFSEKLSVFRALVSHVQLMFKTCVKLLFCGSVLFF